MRNNILLHNLPELPDENCEARLKSVLTTHPTLTEQQVKNIRFERVHRMGKATKYADQLLLKQHTTRTENFCCLHGGRRMVSRNHSGVRLIEVS